MERNNPSSPLLGATTSTTVKNYILFNNYHTNDHITNNDEDSGEDYYNTYIVKPSEYSSGGGVGSSGRVVGKKLLKMMTPRRLESSELEEDNSEKDSTLLEDDEEDEGDDSDSEDEEVLNLEDKDTITTPDHHHHPHILTWRMKGTRIIKSLWWQGPVFVLILLDICLLIVEFVGNESPDSNIARLVLVTPEVPFPPLIALSLALVVTLLAEVLVRVVVFGRAFWKDWINIFELVVMIASLVMFLLLEWVGRLVVIFRVLRLVVRLVRVLVKVTQGKKSLNQAARTTVTENKMRYTKDGWDLDLAYITDNVLVMSLPAMNYQTLYRNHIDDVVRFLDEKHPSAYLIVNCCSEKYANYPIDKFHGRVTRCRIDDHNIAPLHVLLELCMELERWMQGDKNRVLVIHCKGGKGRSGSVVCAWLLYTRVCTNAKDVLDLFGNMRTDPTKKGRIQGVETASQRRYIGYYSDVIEQGLKLPTLVYCEVLRCVIQFTVPDAEVLKGYTMAPHIDITHTDACPVSGLKLSKKAETQQGNKYAVEYMNDAGVGVTVVRDTRIMILLETTRDKEKTFSSLKIGADKKPGKKKICFFYFWVHTSYVGSSLRLEKGEVDKNRKWKKGPFEQLSDFSVEVFFNIEKNNL